MLKVGLVEVFSLPLFLCALGADTLLKSGNPFGLAGCLRRETLLTKFWGKQSYTPNFALLQYPAHNCRDKH